MPRGVSAEHEQQREFILEVAAEAFAEFGYPVTTMVQLAERCQVSKSLLYHYYPAKDAILYDLLVSYMRRLEALVSAVARQGLPAREALAEAVRRFVYEYEHSRARHIVLLNDVRYLPEPAREEILALERRVVQALAELVQASYHIELGQAKVLTMCVFGMINWTFTWLDPKGRISYPDFAEIVVGMLESGLHGGVYRLQQLPHARKSAS
jgi:Transcriptional regulator